MLVSTVTLPPEGANRGRFRDPESDRLIDAAEGLSDLEARSLVYRALQKRVLERLPYVPLWYEDQVYVSRAELPGYQVARDGNYDGLALVRRVSDP